MWNGGLTERELARAYSRRIAQECECGGTILAAGLSDDEILRAMNAHQREEPHILWRREREGEEQICR